MLLDSNIIIYASLPEYAALRRWVVEHTQAVSAISYVEVLGYHGLTLQERTRFEQFFSGALVVPLDQPALDEAVHLRQLRNISLGDSLIAATAIVHDYVLVTNHISDFNWISGLELLNPFTFIDLED